MFHSTTDAVGADKPTVAEYPEFERELDLICQKCDGKAQYKVGRVFIDPSWARKGNDDAGPLKDAICFSGLFRCKHCGSAGPWEVPAETRWLLLGLMLVDLTERNQSQIQFGVMQMFDGTMLQTGAAAEDYLKQKVEQRPDDAFLWGRLGNLYDNAGETDQARPAYEKAVELDPGEIESNYTLGCYRMNEGDDFGAAECFQRVARHARMASRLDPKLLENIVRDSIGRLFDLHCDSDGAIPFPPDFATPPPTTNPDEGPNIISLFEIDLSRDEAWDIMTSICLTGKVPKHIRRREERRMGLEESGTTRNRLSPSSTIAEPHAAETKRRVGRNDRCPCGSGKKYKRCCGSAR